MTQEEYDKLNAAIAATETNVKTLRSTLSGFAIAPNPPSSTTPPPTSETPVTKYVSANPGNVRGDASTLHDPIGTLPMGTALSVIRSNFIGWWRIMSVNGAITNLVGGYVSDTILRDTKV